MDGYSMLFPFSGWNFGFLSQGKGCHRARVAMTQFQEVLGTFEVVQVMTVMDGAETGW